VMFQKWNLFDVCVNFTEGLLPDYWNLTKYLL
jgi:hypothetical protein